ncbi:MAG: FAD-binding protein [Deltaproteobacteria bacterium]|nr:FAD-binding protein [Deltaproteobacteria bacterium]
MFVEKVRTDILCVGGGIAGLMAAIRASELGADVIVADKANTRYSGSSGAGNDHFMCYIPEIHGPDIRPIIEEVQRSLVAGMTHSDFVPIWLERTFDIIKLWDSWGIPMKYNGRYEFAGHGYPGKPLLFIHYSGQHQKKVLTKEALKRGVKIINRVMVFDLITDENRVVGALGTDTREERLIEFRARSVILGTGSCIRLYPAPNPASMFNVAYSPGVTGDGPAMAYRAGAELTNMEIPLRWVGPRYFARCGKATWIGVLRDSQGSPVGPFVTRPERKYGDVASDIYPKVFEDYNRSGKGPVYMDCRGISDEDHEYMMYFFKNEGLSSLVHHLEDERIDLRKNPIEFATYEMMPKGGLYHNGKGETSIKGLFSVGDEAYASMGISMASTYGWLTGEHAVRYAKDSESPDKDIAKEEVNAKKAMVEDIRMREAGPDWKEVNIALQQIMEDYAGSNRSETLLNAGYGHLQRLKDKTLSTVTAKNQHELLRCLEVLDLLDIGETVFVGAKERKETRGMHVRSDYPFTNPLLEKFLLVKRVDNKPVIRWIDIKR